MRRPILPARHRTRPRSHRYARVATALGAAVFAGAAAPLPALPPMAALRPMTTLHAPVVLLRDLFVDAGPEADRVLGPAPSPGGRIIVAAPQLAYIARRFGVNWRPASPGDRAVLERPGRPFTRAEAMAPLRAALTAAGAPPDCDITVTGFDPPLVPLDAHIAPVVAALDYDAGSGRFAAALSLSGPDMDPITVRLTGRAEAVEELPVATSRLAAGTILTGPDLRMARLRVSQVQGAVARTAQQVIGLALRQQQTQGAPFQLAALQPPILVHKGAVVTMQLDSPGIALTAEGQALDDGAAGDHIRVLNPVSHAVIAARVLANGHVRVTPGTPPLVPGANAR